MLSLQQPYKPSPILDAPAFTSDSEVKVSGLLTSQPNALMVNGSTEQLLLTFRQEWK